MMTPFSSAVKAKFWSDDKSTLVAGALCSSKS